MIILKKSTVYYKIMTSSTCKTVKTSQLNSSLRLVQLYFNKKHLNYTFCPISITLLNKYYSFFTRSREAEHFTFFFFPLSKRKTTT